MCCMTSLQFLIIGAIFTVCGLIAFGNHDPILAGVFFGAVGGAGVMALFGLAPKTERRP